jgi:hypothetical protein
MTSDSTVVPLRQPDAVEDPLTTVLREGARRLLAQAVEAEAETFSRRCGTLGCRTGGTVSCGTVMARSG